MEKPNIPNHPVAPPAEAEEMGPFTDRSELDELAHRMFRQFSRFEYALKAGGKRPLNGNAKADWEDFARGIDEEFRKRRDTHAELKAAVDYLMASPPKKQRVVDGELVWEATPAGRGNFTEDLLIYVRRVRNNLFHGGKFSRGWLDPKRSEPLIRHSLTILDACLQLSPGVRAAYEH